jgi:hypothetical protein
MQARDRISPGGRTVDKDVTKLDSIPNMTSLAMDRSVFVVYDDRMSRQLNFFASSDLSVFGSKLTRLVSHYCGNSFPENKFKASGTI